MPKLVVYVSTVTGNMEMKKNQQKIRMVLEGKKIEFETVDISTSSDMKDEMRRIVGNPTALPPQIANGDEYCGDYDAFDNAIEEEKLKEFLKI